MKQHYNTAIYCRLSKDDEKLGIALSIQNQKTLLTDYVQKNGWRVADYYIDSGYSGRNFDRPEFKRMIADIEQGKVDMVIVKDMSRFGRDYLNAGYYIELYFPEKDVRFIALNDGIDSLNKNTDIVPFRNILNEFYARDISKKIKSAVKAKFERGEYHGANAPFGYAKHNKRLVINEVTAKTVRLIFDMSAQGNGVMRIRNALVAGKHLTPSAYLHLQNPKFYAKKFENADETAYYEWSTAMIPTILKNEVYIGNTIHYKEKSRDFKQKKRQTNPKDQWLRIENTHEPIISLEVWEKVQARFQGREQLKRTNPASVLGNVVKCADCGNNMWVSSIQRSKVTGERFKAGTRYMRCLTHNMFGNTKCLSHNINYNKLCQLVLDDIRYFAKIALEQPQELIKSLNKSDNAQKRAYARKVKQDYERKLKRLNELERLLQRLFEDNAIGVVADTNYAVLFEEYQQEQIVLTEQVAELSAQVEELANNADNSEKRTTIIAKYADLQELNPYIVEELCEKILIHQAEKVDGKRIQKIEIFYRFIGEAPITEERGQA